MILNSCQSQKGCWQSPLLFYNWKMILVTGGTGFIGAYLVEHLVEMGEKVRILTRNSNLPAKLKPFEQKIELVLGDITDVVTLKKALTGIEFVVHLAWTTVPKNATENPVFDVQSNVIGTLHLLDQCLVENIKKIIFISSGGTVYGTPKQIPIPETHDLMPISAYGISKVMVEKYIQLYHHLHGLDYTIFRVANAFGEGQNTSTDIPLDDGTPTNIDFTTNSSSCGVGGCNHRTSPQPAFPQHIQSLSGYGGLAIP